MPQYFSWSRIVGVIRFPVLLRLSHRGDAQMQPRIGPATRHTAGRERRAGGREPLVGVPKIA
ncbi:hypothetical protein GCM10011534_04890 [Pseudooceanicola nanhaiensis]|uniref:Uncharacterized protein n=1 Tax=Pseudooceanicola nanhaiensis TaxID=375761 RepID=A0A917SMD2_9RHOB|nr:hypothetical protein GCM10011534_04890 [Pseudooceanicola nanhaiensis]